MRMIANEQKISFWSNGSVLNLDFADGCTHSMNCTLSVNFVVCELHLSEDVKSTNGASWSWCR
jgi:hypothetical protein